MRRTLLLLSLWTGLATTPAFAAEETAAEISRRARERGALNLVGRKAQLKLTTTGKDGKAKEQVLTAASLETPWVLAR